MPPTRSRAPDITRLAVAMIATMALVASPTVSPAVQLLTATALIVGGTNTSTPDDAYLERVKNQVVAPLYPGQDIMYAGVTYPAQAWPVTGLFDLSLGQSVDAGVASLEQAMTNNGNDDLVIFGYSQGALVASLEKRKLAEQYPTGTDAPDIDFVLGGDFNLPNGGINTRFMGLLLPLLGGGSYDPTPTDTSFDTVEIIRQYDGATDFPLYPLNVIADANAILGFLFTHINSTPNLAPDPSMYYQGTYGDTSYYFIPAQHLPLFAPLRAIGIPEPLIDVVEPFFRDIVELGYDRSIPPWEPTPARLIPEQNSGTVVADLVNAIAAGVHNAQAARSGTQTTVSTSMATTRAEAPTRPSHKPQDVAKAHRPTTSTASDGPKARPSSGPSSGGSSSKGEASQAGPNGKR